MYQAIYREYRPKTFDDIIGQDYIVDILRGQIERGEVSHAYLFSGTRGTGKTSLAKVFARAVNCENDGGKKPCMKCEACINSQKESCVDIIEMDAASNNGVDNIRDIREKAYYKPAVLKYKVYIIDEVHMLSSGASNALLKILEEPPEHLIFILATTEAERLPKTILSRVQRFDFRRISKEDIKGRLRDILGEKNIEYEEEALDMIAEVSEGSLRDALSKLEQSLSSKGEKLTSLRMTRALGVVDKGGLKELAKAVLNCDIKSFFEKVEESYEKGVDDEGLIISLISFFRELIIKKVSKNKRQGSSEDCFAKISVSELINANKILLPYINAMQYVKSKRLFVEIAALEVIESLMKSKKTNHDEYEAEKEDDPCDQERFEDEKPVCEIKDKKIEKEKSSIDGNRRYESLKDSICESINVIKDADGKNVFDKSANNDIIRSTDNDIIRSKWKDFLEDDKLGTFKLCFFDTEFKEFLSGVVYLENRENEDTSTQRLMLERNKSTIMPILKKYIDNALDINIIDTRKKTPESEKEDLRREDLISYLGEKLKVDK